MSKALGCMSANSGAEIRFVVLGERGAVMTITVLAFRAAMNSVRPDRKEELDVPLRSAIKTVMPRARPIFATRLPVIVKYELKGGRRIVWSCDDGHFGL